MRAILVVLFAVVALFGYEIRHENFGKFYHFIGEADGERFELYLDHFELEFENFKDKTLPLPNKVGGHLFFRGAKFSFDKGSVEQNSTKIIAINALSDWLNLDVKASQNGDLVGKLAIKGKAMKAGVRLNLEYEVLAVGVQVLGADGARFEAVASDFYQPKFRTKFQKILAEKLVSLRQAWQKTPDKQGVMGAMKRLEYQNNVIKSVCVSTDTTQKWCETTLLKDLKRLGLQEVFVNFDDENLQAIFAKFKAVPSASFTLSPAGFCFQNESEICMPIDEIKPFMKQKFGLVP